MCHFQEENNDAADLIFKDHKNTTQGKKLIQLNLY